MPDFPFIEAEIADSARVRRTIVVMHAPPGNEQFNNNVKDVFQFYIRRFPLLMFCLHGHNHSLSATDIFEDGIIYYGCANIAKRNYLLFTLTPSGYTYEAVDF